MRTKDNNGKWSLENWTTLTVKPGHAPPVAFDLSSPANGAYTSSTPNFQWKKSDYTTFYKLYIDNNNIPVEDSIYNTLYQLTAQQALPAGNHTWHVAAYNTTSTTRTMNVNMSAYSNKPWPFSRAIFLIVFTPPFLEYL